MIYELGKWMKAKNGQVAASSTFEVGFESHQGGEMLPKSGVVTSKPGHPLCEEEEMT